MCIRDRPMRWLPERFRWENYYEALIAAPFMTFFGNSLFLVVVNIVGKLISSSLCAFGFARIRFKGRNAVFGIVMLTMMIPSTVLLIPQFIMWNKVGLYDTYWPLTLPSFFLDAFYIFLLKQFFSTLPMDYDEAATIDGAGYFQIYLRILLPLCKPALMTVAVFTFMNTWNDFMGPLIYLKSNSKFTVSLGLQVFISEFTTDWHYTVSYTHLSDVLRTTNGKFKLDLAQIELAIRCAQHVGYLALEQLDAFGAVSYTHLACI